MLALLFASTWASGPSVTADLYVGTYTGRVSKGIYRVRLDPSTGHLSEPILAGEAVNPSYLALDPARPLLYAVNESDVGEVCAFAIAADGSLSAINSRPSGGNGPCYLSLAPGGRSIMVANYGEGNLTSFAVEADGAVGPQIGEYRPPARTSASGRRVPSHMHMMAVEPSGRFAYACDLGLDDVLTFPYSTKNGMPSLADPKIVTLPAGSGPRHGVVDRRGRILYVANELKATVSVFSVRGRTGPSTDLQNLSTLPAGMPVGNTHTAEIALHPSGKWLYVSNRGYDSIACFRVEPSGTLALLDIYRLTAREPRGFAIDPSGNWLVVAGQNSNDLAALRIDLHTGRLTEFGSSVKVPTPVCVVFRPTR